MVVQLIYAISFVYFIANILIFQHSKYESGLENIILMNSIFMFIFILICNITYFQQYSNLFYIFCVVSLLLFLFTKIKQYISFYSKNTEEHSLIDKTIKKSILCICIIPFILIFGLYVNDLRIVKTYIFEKHAVQFAIMEDAPTYYYLQPDYNYIIKIDVNSYLGKEIIKDKRFKLANQTKPVDELELFNEDGDEK